MKKSRYGITLIGLDLRAGKRFNRRRWRTCQGGESQAQVRASWALSPRFIWRFSSWVGDAPGYEGALYGGNDGSERRAKGCGGWLVLDERALRGAEGKEKLLTVLGA